MKNYTVAINVCLVLINIAMVIALVNIFLLGDAAQLWTLVALFVPLLVQLLAAAFFFLVIVPLRSLFARPPPPVLATSKTVKAMQSGKMNQSFLPPGSPKVKWGH